MIFRNMMLALVALVLTAAAPPMPPELARHISGGETRVTDFQWMRGAFSEASEQERAEYEAIDAWLKACHAADRRRVTAELEALGVAADRLESIPVASVTCGQAVIQIDHTQFADFAQLDEAVTQARPVFNAMISSARVASRNYGAKSDELDDQLLHKPMVEQIYRFSHAWAAKSSAPADAPELTLDQSRAFSAMLRDALVTEDMANTDWLKEVVAQNGWPKITSVGKQASSAAWLLAQHADHDPAFQLEMLRLMEPLVAADEVSKRNYAYLYDRVMLKLAGTQRYATQAECVGGTRQPRPLEAGLEVGEALDASRAAMDLEPLAEYFGWFSPCPAE